MVLTFYKILYMQERKGRSVDPAGTYSEPSTVLSGIRIRTC